MPPYYFSNVAPLRITADELHEYIKNIRRYKKNQDHDGVFWQLKGILRRSSAQFKNIEDDYELLFTIVEVIEEAVSYVIHPASANKHEKQEKIDNLEKLDLRLYLAWFQENTMKSFQPSLQWEFYKRITKVYHDKGYKDCFSFGKQRDDQNKDIEAVQAINYLKFLGQLSIFNPLCEDQDLQNSQRESLLNYLQPLDKPQYKSLTEPDYKMLEEEIHAASSRELTNIYTHVPVSSFAPIPTGQILHKHRQDSQKMEQWLWFQEEDILDEEQVEHAVSHCYQVKAKLQHRISDCNTPKIEIDRHHQVKIGHHNLDLDNRVTAGELHAIPLDKIITDDRINIVKNWVTNNEWHKAYLYLCPLALWLAASCGDLGMMQSLIGTASYIDVKRITPEGFAISALSKAAEMGHLGAVKYLVERKAKVNSDNFDRVIPPLFLAVKSNQMDVAKYLLKQGADVNWVHYHGSTPLKEAARNGKLEMVKLIEKYKARLEVENKVDHLHHSKDFDYSTPLMIAAKNNHQDVVKYLIQRPNYLSEERKFVHKILSNENFWKKQTFLNIYCPTGISGMQDTLEDYSLDDDHLFVKLKDSLPKNRQKCWVCFSFFKHKKLTRSKATQEFYQILDSAESLKDFVEVLKLNGVKSLNDLIVKSSIKSSSMLEQEKEASNKLSINVH